MVTTKPRLMVIGATWEQVPLIRAACEEGCHVLATGESREAVGLEVADEWEILNPRDLGHALEIAHEFGADGVTADECDYSHYAAVYVAERLGLPNAGLAAAQLTTNKSWMREESQKYHVLQPRFVECRLYEEAENAVEIIGWPVILKPVDNRGAAGVTVARSYEDLKTGYLEALRYSFSRTVIVEAYIEGVHITVDGCVDQDGNHHNLALASKRIAPDDNPLIVEVNYPGDVSPDVADHLYKVNQQVVEAVGISAGLTHTEFILDRRGRCFLVEIANRGGGVLTSAKIVPEVSGVDLSRLLVRNALGRRFDVKPGQSGRLVSLRFISFPAGTVREVRGVDAVRSWDGVLHIAMLVGPGSCLSEPRSGHDRHGFAIFTGHDSSEIDRLHQAVLESVEVVYEAD